ncbi:MAG TPA: PBP1A family penicillin-binding protein [Fibrobacteria bacterium]|nr:PBP1A family penicillin-binding protein [Fibrobacteria bacterium]
MIPFKFPPGIQSLFADPEFRHWFRVLGYCFAVPFAALALVLACFWFTLPPLEQLERLAPSLITRMYSKDSALIREFYTERRIWISLDKVPERQIDAVLAIEDQGFFRHSGVDLAAIPASLLPAMTGKRVRGGSTLTQQLTKLVFLGPERSLSRKLREILLALRIEGTYTKKEILEFYLNEVYLGAGAYGFAAAAERYFSRPLDSLSLPQQALLAGMLQRPELLRPDRHPVPALRRRNVVLRSMQGIGAVTQGEMKDASARPLELRMKEFPQLSGDEAGYFVETVRKELEGRWGKGFLDSAGTRIYTTLDRRAQDLADSCLAGHLAGIQERMNAVTMLDLGMPGRLRKSREEILAHWDLYYARFDSLYLRKDTLETRKFPKHARYHRAQGAVVVIENGSGAVRALSGGLDWRESNYNRATMAARSPGSAFKPIVYAVAVDRGVSPGSMVSDRPLSMPDPDDPAKQWRPHNLEYDYEGDMTLRRAFYRSRNIPAIRVALDAGLDSVAAYALRFGISRPLRPVPAMALGACDASPLEMTAAYSVFPGGGEWVRPRFLEAILDRKGASIPHHPPVRRRVMGEAAAWILSGMLRDVNIRGTAADVWAGGFYHPSGGKTGTTNDYRDAWYIGFTKRYTVGVWVGTDDHESLGPGHTGTDDAMPIWVDVMRGLHRGIKVREFETEFPRPPGVADVRICKLTGKLAQSFCDSVAQDFKVAGLGPKLPPCRAEWHAARRESQGEGRRGSGIRRYPSGISIFSRAKETSRRGFFVRHLSLTSAS